MILLIKSGGVEAFSEWRACFASVLPAFEVRMWGDPEVPPAAVRYALVWEPERGGLACYPNLRLVISAGAGVEHVLADDLRPPGLPLARLVLPETRQGMAEFVAMGTLMLMRGMRKNAWKNCAPVTTGRRMRSMPRRAPFTKSTPRSPASSSKSSSCATAATAPSTN